MNAEQLGITKEEIMDLAASKIAAQFIDTEHLYDKVDRLVNQQVSEAVKTGLGDKIETLLSRHMESLLAQEIQPVTIWGETTGKPTTIKGALEDHAKRFWNQKVDADGKATDYYGAKPRFEWLFNKVVAEDFRKAVEQNITNMVGAFKDALAKDAGSKIEEHINNIIRVKTR